MSELRGLASIAERIGAMKKKEIKSTLSEQTGLKDKEIDKALPGVQSAFRGAQVAQSQGMDPHKVGVSGLQKMDPEAGKTPKASSSAKQNLSHQEVLTGALIGMLPGLVASAIAGPKGGQIAAEGAGKAGTLYMQGKKDEFKQERHDKERAEDIEFKKKGQSIQEKLAQGQLAQKTHDRDYKDKMAGLKEREVSAKEQKLLASGNAKDKDGNPILKPSKLSQSQAAKLANLMAARDMLEDAKKAIIAQSSHFGLWNSAKDAFTVNDPEIGPLDTLLKKTGVLTGVGINGRALTLEETNKWEKELTRSQTPEILLRKLEIFEKQVADQENAHMEINNLNKQPLTGYIPSEKKTLSLTEDKPADRDPFILDTAKQNNMSYEAAEILLRKKGYGKKE